jgi:asparagine synthase (glutamine-hydrolysing)
MAFSLESRLPFLDYRLVEFAFSLASSFKISHGINKKILREAVAHTIPPSILHRKDKMGFVSPQVLWQKDSLMKWMKEVIFTPDNSGLFRQEVIPTGYSKYLNSDDPSLPWLWWRIFCFKFWYFNQ